MTHQVLRALRWIWLLPLAPASVIDIDTAWVTTPTHGSVPYLLVGWFVATAASCWTVQQTLRTSRSTFDPSTTGLDRRLVVSTLGLITASIVVPMLVEGHAVVSTMSLWSGLVLTGVLAARAHTKWDLTAVGWSAVLVVAPMILGGDTADGLLTSGSITMVVIATTMGLLVREQHRRVAVVRTAAIQHERMAIARELHDSVAHELTGILVLSRANRSNGRVSGPSGTRSHDHSGDVFGLIADASQRALDDIRVLVSRFDSTGPSHDTDPSYGADPTFGADPAFGRSLSSSHAGMATMLDAFAASTTATVRVDLTDVNLTPSEWLTIERICAEALTNIRRHAADAKQVIVELTHPDDVVRLTIADDGQSGTGIGGGLGTGIDGARRRIQALGGTLIAGRGDDGWWRITAEIPRSTGEVGP